MDSKSLSEQEKDIKDLLRRAERTPVKTSALRRDTLKRLIDLAHSPYASLKIAAATNLKLFIKDFPELEDDAINAVYDLCEDPVATVRIKGYAAIVDVSREQNKWVKRNADVLVQLLQSDEPEEVTFVKRALTQHLDMDPVVTLGVLCDQVVPLDEPLDEEEKAIRERLRSLVITFLAGEAKRPLVERHAAVYGSPAENILVSGLFKAITRLASNDVDVIVKDIIVALPSFKAPSPRGRELLDVLLTQIRAIVKSTLTSDGDSAMSNRARYYLDLASFITLDKRMVHPSHLLRFYYTSLTPKSVLGRFSEEDQGLVINGVARTFSACEEAGTRRPPTAPAADLGKTPGSGSDAAEDVALRKQFPDVCAVLLHVVADMTIDEHRPWSACHVLVQAIARRKRDQRWEIPQHITTALRRIESISPSQEASADAKAAQGQVHSVIRQSLLEPVKFPATSDTALVMSSKRSPDATDEQKGNVNKPLGNGAQTGDAHAIGIAGILSTSGKGDRRRLMNVTKRKLDASDGPSLPTTPSGSRGTATPGTLTTGVPGRPASLPPRPSPATVASSFAGAPSAPRAERQRDRQAPPHLREKGPRSSPRDPPAPAGTTGSPTNEAGVALVPSESALVDDSSGPSTKRQRTEDHGRRGRGARGVGLDSAQNGGNTVVGVPGGPRVNAQVSPKAKGEDSKTFPSLLSRFAGGPKAPSVTVLEHDQAQRDQERGRGGRNKRDRDAESDKEPPKSESTMQPAAPSRRRAEEIRPPPTSQPTPTPARLSSYSNPVPPRQPHSSAFPGGGPAIGFSIRGAAKAASVGLSEGSSGKGPASLLERLQIQEGGLDGGGRRRKRTKHS